MRRSKKNNTTLDPNLSKGIGAVLLVILAVLISLSFFNKAGTLGIIINEYILSFLFGTSRFLTPLIILVIAWFFIKDIDYSYKATHGVGAVLFFITVSSILHLQISSSQMWSETLLGHGGGLLGMIAWPMQKYLGEIASWVVLIGLLFISILLMFNTLIVHFILFHKKLLAGLGAIGQGVFQNTKNIFVKTNNIKVHGDYEEEIKFTKNKLNTEEEEKEVEEEAPIKNLKKEEPEENEEETEEIQTETVSPNPVASPWSQKVIIKDLPPLPLLSDKKSKPTSGDIKSNAQVISDTLREFNIDVEMGEVRVGPTVTQYSLKPNKGVKLSRITGLSNDLALALAAHPIRIEAPIPGKSLVGIEVPNQKTALVSLKELLESKEFKERPHNMMIGLGKDVAGKVWFADLPRMPHLLIAGTTGSGKTVCVNTAILSLLYQNTAETLRIIMVDPKRVELTLYNGIPHLLTPVITNVQKTVNALKWTIGEMERRFELLAEAGCRDIHSYNSKHPQNKIPYIVFIIDELADLMAAAAGEIESGIIRIAQMARAVGIHLIVATQRPSVDVITGLMKANIPARIAFSVASIIDSRTILDCPGAEKLLGRGDMLFLTSELSKPVRVQGAFVSEDELKQVVEYLRGDEEPIYDESIVNKSNASGTVNMFGGPTDEQDPLFEEAKQAIIEAGKASASYLQRKLKVGYARAARILDELEIAGVIGPADGAKPREILVTETEIDDTMDAGGDLNVFGDNPTENKIEDKSSDSNEQTL